MSAKIITIVKRRGRWETRTRIHLSRRSTGVAFFDTKREATKVARFMKKLVSALWIEDGNKRI